nr:ChaA [Streptomyces sp.]
MSPTIESGVEAADLPHAVVGVINALLVLLPETIAALRSARRDRVQTSLDLALGSAMASIGLSIPAVVLASVWLSGPLVLGLGATHMVMLALTVVVSSLTVVPGRATPLQGGVHLVLFAAYLELGDQPLTTLSTITGHSVAGTAARRGTGRVSGSNAKHPRLNSAIPVRYAPTPQGTRPPCPASAVATIGVSAPPRTPPRL